jgi:hypothetical protein
MRSNKLHCSASPSCGFGRPRIGKKQEEKFAVVAQHDDDVRVEDYIHLRHS